MRSLTCCSSHKKTKISKSAHLHSLLITYHSRIIKFFEIKAFTEGNGEGTGKVQESFFLVICTNILGYFTDITEWTLMQLSLQHIHALIERVIIKQSQWSCNCLTTTIFFIYSYTIIKNQFYKLKYVKTVNA